MLDIKTLALLLLIGRAVSVAFIVLVLNRQWRLLKLPIDSDSGYSLKEIKEIKGFRKLLFFLSVIILVGNFIPIVIDTITMFVETSRPPQVRTISLMYAFSNSITAAISAGTIWLIYRTSGRRQEVDNEVTAKQLVKTDKTEKDLRAEIKRNSK